MWIKKYFSSPTAAVKRRPPTRRNLHVSRLRLEPLEDRRMLAFSPVATYAAGANPRAVDAGDFDGDGHADLVTANGPNLGLLLNNGDGTFQPSVIIPIDGQVAMEVVVGDLNADGKLDLTATSSTTEIIGSFPGYYGYYPIYGSVGHLKVLLGNGDGTFTPVVGQDFGGGRFFSAALGDLDNDGDVDVALSNWDGTDLSVLLGNGDGTFGAPQGWAVGAAAQQVDIADLNGDGALDLVTTNLSGNVKVLLGNGNGTFQPAQSVSAGPNAQGQAVGDVNGDGKLDLAVTSFLSNIYYGPYGSYGSYSEVKVMVLLGHGDGTFAAGNGYLVDQFPLEPLALSDVDGDGKLDIVAASYDSGNVSVLRGVGDGTFLAAQTFFTGGSGGGPADIVVADLNDDAALDVAAANFGYNTLKVFLNTNGVDPPPVPPSMSIDDVTVAEGNSGTQAVAFTVSLSAAAAGPVTVNYATANGSAAANGDYQLTSGIVSFAPGELSKIITVLVKGDRAAESDESFFVNLSGASGATLDDGQALGTILDDEPRISISDVVRQEGNSGTTRFVFDVTLSTASTSRVTVNYATANGTASKSDNDYTAKSGKLTFAPGETVRTVTISVKGDKKKEADESFFVNLSRAVGAELDDGRGEGRILNDDNPRKRFDWISFASNLDDTLDDMFSSRRKRR